MSFITPSLLSKVTDAIYAFVNAAVTKLNGAIEDVKTSLKNYVSNETLESKLEGYVESGAIADMATKTDLDGYQPKGDYASKDDLNGFQPKGNYASMDDLNGFLSDSDLNDKLEGYLPSDALDGYTDTENMNKAIDAAKNEINQKIDSYTHPTEATEDEISSILSKFTPEA